MAPWSPCGPSPTLGVELPLDAFFFRRGTNGSNPVPSKGESVAKLVRTMEPRRPCSSAQFVDLGEPGILAQQIGQSAALKPFTVPRWWRKQGFEPLVPYEMDGTIRDHPDGSPILRARRSCLGGRHQRRRRDPCNPLSFRNTADARSEAASSRPWHKWAPYHRRGRPRSSARKQTKQPTSPARITARTTQSDHGMALTNRV